MIRNEIDPSCARHRVWAWRLPAYVSFLIHLAIHSLPKSRPAIMPPGFLLLRTISSPCLPRGREQRKLRVHLLAVRAGRLELHKVKPDPAPLRSSPLCLGARSREVNLLNDLQRLWASLSPFPNPGLDLLTHVPAPVARYGWLEWSETLTQRSLGFVGKEACLISNVGRGHGVGGVMLHTPPVYHP